MVTNNTHCKKISSLHVGAGILFFLASIYGFLETHEHFQFTNLVVNIYTFFVSLGVILVGVSSLKGLDPPGVLSYFSSYAIQFKFLFFYSWLTIGLSATSQVFGILVLIYSFFGWCYLVSLGKPEPTQTQLPEEANIRLDGVV